MTQQFNPLSASPTKWPNTLKEFVGKLPKNCLGVFEHFVGLALKGLRKKYKGACCQPFEAFLRIFAAIFAQNPQFEIQ